jgi:hypothetical protein
VLVDEGGGVGVEVVAQVPDDGEVLGRDLDRLRRSLYRPPACSVVSVHGPRGGVADERSHFQE